jgi:hypothetical protein
VKLVWFRNSSSRSCRREFRMARPWKFRLNRPYTPHASILRDARAYRNDAAIA